jgi:uncharacterized protein YlxW (UPF0749 family)
VIVAIAALIVAGVALRDAHRSAKAAHRAEARASEAQSDVAREQTRLAQLASTAKAVGALCHSSRHASIPNSTVYAVTVAREIIHGIVTSCDYAHVPEIP